MVPFTALSVSAFDRQSASPARQDEKAAAMRPGPERDSRATVEASARSHAAARHDPLADAATAALSPPLRCGWRRPPPHRRAAGDGTPPAPAHTGPRRRSLEAGLARWPPRTTALPPRPIKASCHA